MGLEHTTDDGFLWSPNALKSSSLESKLERLHADRTIGCNFSLSIYGLLVYCKTNFQFCNIANRDQDCSHISGLLQRPFLPQDS